MTMDVSLSRLAGLLCVLLFACSSAIAQPFRAHVELLAEHHTMGSLRAYQDHAQRQMLDMGFSGATQVHQYPPFLGFRVYAGKERAFNSPDHYGVILGYRSTGARTGHREENGTFNLDQRLTTATFGMLYEHPLGSTFASRSSRVPFMYLTPRVEWNRLTQEEHLSGLLQHNLSRTYDSFQPAIEGGVGYRFMQGEGTRYVRLAAGASWRFPSRFRGSTGLSGLLTPPTDTIEGPDGGIKHNGFGFHVSLGYALTR